MKKNIRSLCINRGVTFVTLLIVAIFFELVAFRFILPAAELPAIDATGPVIKYKPGQTGTYRLRDEIESDFAINQQGWNSGKTSYVTEKTGPRIAIIGDSYVEALQVTTDSSMAEQMEAMGQGDYEVYRFGMSEAPLSQYLHMLRMEVLPYRPDLVIFNLVHNDFNESWPFMPGAYTSAFLKLRMDGDTVTGEIMPAPYRPKWYEPIRRSNTWRYLGVRQQVRLRAIRNLILGEKTAPAKVQVNIDVTALDSKASRNPAATRYILNQANTLCHKIGARFLVVMDGVRQLIYSTPDGLHHTPNSALSLNTMVERTCNELSIPCIDLHPVFEAHYLEHGQRFEFQNDGHWNKLGHTVAATAIADWLRTHPFTGQ